MTAPHDEGTDRALRFWLGLSLLLLLIERLPGPLGGWSISAFGYVGAAEPVIFLLGASIAAPLVRVYAEAGAAQGALRSLHRSWQLYWRYLGAILISGALSALLIGGDRATALAGLDLSPLAADPATTLFEIASFQFLPAFFAVAGVYVAILALSVPLIGLARLNLYWGLACVAAAYLAAQFGVGFPGWTLNPLAWALLFMAGVAFGAGWIKTPEVTPGAGLDRRFFAATAILAIALAVAPSAVLGGAWRGAATPLGWEAEATLGPVRLLHFAALAYFALVATASLQRRNIFATGAAREIATLGAQALVTLVALHPVAALAQALARPSLGAPFLGPVLAILVAVAAVALLFLCVATARWFDDPPWGKPAPKPRG